METRCLALVGLPGSGKSVVCDLVTQAGFTRVYFGGLTLERLKAENLAVNPKNEKMMRERLRQEYGMAAYATLNLPKIKTALKEGRSVIIDGLYSWEEYLVLKKELPNLEVVAVYAPPKLRYERLANRPERPFTPTEAQDRDYSQIENLHQAGPIAMADVLLHNVGSKDNLIDQVKHQLKLA